MSEKIKIQNKEVEIKKLPLGKYGELIKVLKTIAGPIGGLGGLSNAEIFAKLPDLITECYPQAIQIISIGTGVSEADLQDIGLDEAVDCVIEMIHVNRYFETYEKVKKEQARYRQPNQKPNPTSIGTTG